MAKQTKRSCVYAGSFDPPTMGHVYMIREGARMFDHFIVAVGDNPDKTSTFPLEERLKMLRSITSRTKNAEVDHFASRFLVDYAKRKGAGHILRGIRNEQDYAFERTMRNVNGDLAPAITTVFLIPPRERYGGRKATEDASELWGRAGALTLPYTALVAPSAWAGLVSEGRR